MGEVMYDIGERENIGRTRSPRDNVGRENSLLVHRYTPITGSADSHTVDKPEDGLVFWRKRR